MADATLTIKQGEDWDKLLTIQYSNGSLYDLSIYSAAYMQIKATPQDTNPVVTVTTALLPSTSQIKINLTHEQTSAIPAWGKTSDDVTNYVSDIFLATTTNTIKKLCSLNIEVEPEVTKI
ncbi:hypothetical protein Ga0466249_002303 [Sporomusaceae bacterium BoRhaA]|uniref:hypothetical protein n=1 Tax=Pelorhabdus rhamnosifermentans TaxID=2772457 RepID=UPI001C06478F|nr:hypothetical protein [Pelorhabdus rhamnosifermentans]MBU2701189.1 hypothetical protein [Pelorhabdus rhamnosifermentans]